MKWLLWKDYRQNRLVVFAGLLLLLAPYLIALCVIFWSKDSAARHWGEAIAIASIYSLMISQVTVALIGGNAIAGERVDRSAEFLASLPISRRRILVSKLVFALMVVGVAWLLNTPIAWCFRDLLHLNDQAFLRFVMHIATTGLVFFCVAWFLSSFLTSPTFSVSGGLLAPLLFFLTMYFIAYLLDVVPLMDRVAEPCYRVFCLGLSPVCFAVGTWHYLRRVEP